MEAADVKREVNRALEQVTFSNTTSFNVMTALLMLALAVGVTAVILAIYGFSDTFQPTENSRRASSLTVTGRTETALLAVASNIVSPSAQLEALTVSGDASFHTLDVGSEATFQNATATTARVTDVLRTKTIRSTSDLDTEPLKIDGASRATNLKADLFHADAAVLQAAEVEGVLDAAVLQTGNLTSTASSLGTSTANSLTAQTLAAQTLLTANNAEVKNLVVTDTLSIQPTIPTLTVQTLQYRLPRPAHVSLLQIDSSPPDFVAQILQPSAWTTLGLNAVIIASSLGGLGPTYTLVSGSPNDVSQGGSWTVPQAGAYTLSVSLTVNSAALLDLQWANTSAIKLTASTFTGTATTISCSGTVYLGPPNAGTGAQINVRSRSGSPVTILSASAYLQLLSIA